MIEMHSSLFHTLDKPPFRNMNTTTATDDVDETHLKLNEQILASRWTSYRLDHGGEWVMMRSFDHAACFFATEAEARAAVPPADECIAIVRLVPAADEETLRDLYSMNRDQLHHVAYGRWVAFANDWFGNDDRRSFATRAECERWATERRYSPVLLVLVGDERAERRNPTLDYRPLTAERLEALVREAFGARPLAEAYRELAATFTDLTSMYYLLADEIAELRRATHTRARPK